MQCPSEVVVACEPCSEMELQNVSKDGGGFLRMNMMPSPSNQVLQSRVKSPIYFPPTPDRSALYELTVHDLTYKVRLTIPLHYPVTRCEEVCYVS